MESIAFKCSIYIKLMYILMGLILSCQAEVHYKSPPHGLPSFMAVWNSPTELCMDNFQIKVDVSLFHIVGNPVKTSKAQNITIFYTDRLGYYPSINEVNGTISNGGIPQMVDIDLHLKKAKEDILHYIPSTKQSGLAVIDWEDWRPTWIRNWASKVVYRTHSIEFVLQNSLTITKEKAAKIAKDQFESAAQSFLLRTLRLGKSLRPNYLWGFYLFPNCYNYHYKSKPMKYTGHCPEIEKLRNDKLAWLWKESTALYPNIYLETALKSSDNAAMFSRHRIQEAFRLSSLSKYSLPIYAYIRPVFTDRAEEFLSEVDLRNTIGESIALGVDGFVMWGDFNITLSMKACSSLKSYLANTLNPYVINVTLASKFCSSVLCHNNGLCKRKQWDSNTYLHLNPESVAIEQKNGNYFVKGYPTSDDLNYFLEYFTCHCYAGRKCHLPYKIHNQRLTVCMPNSSICIKA
ncbi:hypothetical protein GDO86_005898 [Hymenochirus boettgeri]|uniref:Hyaluronidase n=1 Tax=Hymenochirus boettgeri TaxID=247094 RepID=A0A8T2J3X8_9PIPI|nr:hypothetical protein GDO86_005898 [Hymenochirus boettgeri]